MYSPYSNIQDLLNSLPILYLEDLIRQRGALFAEFITNADLSRTIIYTFKGGRQERETTSPCRLIRVPRTSISGSTH